jgi:hypothetical protein
MWISEKKCFSDSFLTINSLKEKSYRDVSGLGRVEGQLYPWGVGGVNSEHAPMLLGAAPYQWAGLLMRIAAPTPPMPTTTCTVNRLPLSFQLASAVSNWGAGILIVERYSSWGERSKNPYCWHVNVTSASRCNLCSWRKEQESFMLTDERYSICYSRYPCQQQKGAGILSDVDRLTLHLQPLHPFAAAARSRNP